MTDPRPEVGAPIDSARLYWFIGKFKYVRRGPLPLYEVGFNAALDELSRWLRAGGY